MKILYIGNPESVHDLKLINFFSQKGHETFFVSGEPLKQEQEIVNDTEKNIFYLPNPFSLSKPFGTWKSILFLRKIIKEKEIDLVHVLFATPYSLWTIFLNLPYLITTRGSDALIVLPGLLNSQGLGKLKSYLFYSLFFYSFRKASGITSTSNEQAKKLKELFPVISAPYIIRSGIPVEKILQTPDNLPATLKNKKYILSPRFFKPVYQIHMQLEAIAGLDKEFLQTYFFVFIRGKEYDKKYAIDIENKLAAIHDLNFFIFDYFSQEELWSLMRNAELILNTPISDGTPNSALEAMVLEKKMILGPFSYDDIFENICLKMESNDPEELRNLIKKALNNYPQELIKKARARAEAVDIHQEMEKMEDLYNRIIRKL